MDTSQYRRRIDGKFTFFRKAEQSPDKTCRLLLDGGSGTVLAEGLGEKQLLNYGCDTDAIGRYLRIAQVQS